MVDTAINVFKLLPGVSLEDFNKFSSELDRPSLLALDEVQKFDVYLVESPVDAEVEVVEVMAVRDWAEWERVRDSSPLLEPVVQGFNALVDQSSVRTYFVRQVDANEQEDR